MRIERLPYFVDIVQDIRSSPAVWHCIVQRHGSSEVLAWFQETSEDIAQQSAVNELEHLRRQDLERAGQLPLSLMPGPNRPA